MLDKKLKQLAVRYYGTDDLAQLKPYQIDKLVTWATNHSVKRGAGKDRRAGRIKGRFIQ